jgi:hypothetical protein
MSDNLISGGLIMTSKNMTKEDQQLEENEDSTLDEKRNSEEADEDLDSLFAEDEEQEDEAPISREEYNRLLKGTKKLATELGRIKSQPKTEVKEKEPTKEVLHQIDDVSELFFNQMPKAELVNDDLRAVADAKYGGSILKAWKGESWLQDKATSLENANKDDEENKGKINKPSSGIVPSKKIDVRKVKPEDVSKLTPAQKSEWVRHQASIEVE